MTLGRAPSQGDAFRSTRSFCEERLSPTSVYRLLHEQAHRIFPDDAFADLFQERGRNSVPPQIVAVVMVLQRMEGLSDREAVERFEFDARWKFAAGGLDFEHPSFVHTVLVAMRARLLRSSRPDRIFEAVLDVAKAAGLVGRKRVLDSTALYDAVATQDTVTMIRASIRGLLRVASPELADEVRAVLKRDDDYASPGKPACEWDDKAAREALVDALARDAYAVIRLLDGQELAAEVREAAALIATVVGQDIEVAGDVFRILRGVAPDRVISTVDPEARHGHKTSARGFDGYKGHIAIDPDSEIITATQVTAGNVADGKVAMALIQDVLPEATSVAAVPVANVSTPSVVPLDVPVPLEVYGDASYGTGEILAQLEGRSELHLKVQLPSAREGQFSKEDFSIDLEKATVTCPAGVIAQIAPLKDRGGAAEFGQACKACPLREKCTNSKTGRTITLNKHERLLQKERARQKNREWQANYKATRPKVERKQAHMMRRRHGGRRARVRGTLRIGHDFALLAAATNLRRLAVLLS